MEKDGDCRNAASNDQHVRFGGGLANGNDGLVPVGAVKLDRFVLGRKLDDYGDAVLENAAKVSRLLHVRRIRSHQEFASVLFDDGTDKLLVFLELVCIVDLNDGDEVSLCRGGGNHGSFDTLWK